MHEPDGDCLGERPLTNYKSLLVGKGSNELPVNFKKYINFTGAAGRGYNN